MFVLKEPAFFKAVSVFGVRFLTEERSWERFSHFAYPFSLLLIMPFILISWWRLLIPFLLCVPLVETIKTRISHYKNKHLIFGKQQP